MRPVRFLETHYWYPVRRRFDLLPPIRCASTPDAGVLLVLTTPASWYDAVWSAWSYLRYLGGRLHLTIACDGVPPLELTAAAFRLFPGSEVINVRTLVASLDDGRPLREFAAHNPFGNKLRLVMAMQERSPVLYSDSDVLVHNTPVEILDHLDRQPDTPLYMQSEALCGDPWVMQRAADLGTSLNERFNFGQVWVPRGSLSTTRVSELLRGWTPECNGYFAEQSIVSVLLTEAGGIGLPIDRYVANAQRMFYFENDVDYRSLACRHYVNLIRHLMYSRGIPLLLGSARQ